MKAPYAAEVTRRAAAAELSALALGVVALYFGFELVGRLNETTRELRAEAEEQSASSRDDDASKPAESAHGSGASYDSAQAQSGSASEPGVADVQSIFTEPSPAPAADEQVFAVKVSLTGGASPSFVVLQDDAFAAVAQRIRTSVEFPRDFIVEGWQAGFGITSLSGDSDGWLVVMSAFEDVEFEQRVIFNFDQTELKARMDAGYSITSVGGWGGTWTFVLSRGFYGEQRYTLPTPLNDARRTWIQARWNEGFRITSVAGADLENIEDDGFVFVMSRQHGLGHGQTYHGPGPWPSLWIEQQTAQGYGITSVAGFGQSWVVVMSEDALSEPSIAVDVELPLNLTESLP